MKRAIAIAIVLSVAALGFRLFLALRLPNDEPDDGRVYARIALNVLDHQSYSLETTAPYSPTFIRVPGYPLFLAGVYKLFGRENNCAVRVVQAVLDAAECWAVALLALAWAPRQWGTASRRRAMLVALALAAACPFTAIYVTTLLTETCTTLLIVLSALATTLALRSSSQWRCALWWAVTGLLEGGATLFRPEAGLLAAASGLMLLILGLGRAWLARRDKAVQEESNEFPLQILSRTVAYGGVLTLAFCAALVPWTVRNVRVIGVFQPIAPFHTNMPNEFAPVGYGRWLRTWVDDSHYVEPFQFALDTQPIHIESAPDYAFDSPEERSRVAVLLDRYNHAEATTPTDNSSTGEAGQAMGQAVDDREPNPPTLTAGAAVEIDVEMTPEIDAEFNRIADERIARHPIRYYLVLPLKRLATLWFDTHSQYYPFQGELFPLSNLDEDIGQHVWLPLFALFTWGYTIIGALAVWVFWRYADCRKWILLLALFILPRLALLCAMENPEPRYVVEFFALLAAAGGLPLAAWFYSKKQNHC